MILRLTLTFFAFIFFGNNSIGQCDSSIQLNQNNLDWRTQNDGNIFWNLNSIYNRTIFSGGIWIGGIQPSGSLSLAAATYSSTERGDYWAGPLDENDGIPLENNCENYAQFWEVFGFEIEQHIEDFNDNGIIDNPIPNIIGYPAYGNNLFESIYDFSLPDTPQKLAPFFDANNDGIYNPNFGDYPLPHSVKQGIIPAQIVFAIFNDAGGAHTLSQGEVLRTEIHYTAWTFNCIENEILNNTLFTNHKIINRRGESLDSLHVGIWMDFDLGCYTDDFIGSSPGNNSYFVYNRDSLDGTNGVVCDGGVPTFAENPPVQSVTFLNQEMDHFMYMMNPTFGNVLTEVTDPTLPEEYYNYLTGSFKDGSPLYFGGSGFNNSSNDFTNFAFPGNPIDSLTEWTMHDFFLDPNIAVNFSDTRAIGSIDFETLNHGNAVELDMAYTFHQGENSNYLENVSLMFDNLPLLQQMYDEGFENYCTPDFSINTETIPISKIDIFPNPTSDFLNIDLKEKEFSQLIFFDSFGNVLLEKEENLTGIIEFSVNHFPSGLCFIHLKKDNRITSYKFIISN